MNKLLLIGAVSVLALCGAQVQAIEIEDNQVPVAVADGGSLAASVNESLNNNDLFSNNSAEWNTFSPVYTEAPRTSTEVEIEIGDVMVNVSVLDQYVSGVNNKYTPAASPSNGVETASFPFPGPGGDDPQCCEVTQKTGDISGTWTGYNRGIAAVSANTGLAAQAAVVQINGKVGGR